MLSPQMQTTQDLPTGSLCGGTASLKALRLDLDGGRSSSSPWGGVVVGGDAAWATPLYTLVGVERPQDVLPHPSGEHLL